MTRRNVNADRPGFALFAARVPICQDSGEKSSRIGPFCPMCMKKAAALFGNRLIPRADTGTWTRDLFLTKEVLYRWAKTATFSISSGAKVYNKNEITKKSADFYRRMRSRFSSYLCKWHKINSLVFYTGCVFSCQAGKCIGFSDLTIYFYKQKKAQLISV